MWNNPINATDVLNAALDAGDGSMIAMCILADPVSQRLPKVAADHCRRMVGTLEASSLDLRKLRSIVACMEAGRV